MREEGGREGGGCIKVKIKFCTLSAVQFLFLIFLYRYYLSGTSLLIVF